MAATPAHGRGLARVLGGAPDPDAPRVVFRVAGRVVPATGEVVVKTPHSAGVVGGVDVKRAKPALLVPAADWIAYGLGVGSFATVDGTEYEIASATPSDSGLIEAMLRDSR